MVNVMNIYFLDLLWPVVIRMMTLRYQTSQFNDFSRVDGFDSDLWNNNECFDKNEASSLAQINLPIDIALALADANQSGPKVPEVRVGSEGGRAKQALVDEMNGNECSDWKALHEASKRNPLEARQIAFSLLGEWKPEWNANTIDRVCCIQ
jgi:hypothetical protein